MNENETVKPFFIQLFYAVNVYPIGISTGDDITIHTNSLQATYNHHTCAFIAFE